jgi:glycosyltransferase involved in cell wall biosynthesis
MAAAVQPLDIRGEKVHGYKDIIIETRGYRVANESLVSVIVPTKNNEATIERCLASIREQSYPNIEVIVVDNYSTDRTARIAEGFGFKLLLKGPERNPQRNFGAQQAGGEYLLFIDSDMELEPDVVADCVARVQRERTQAVTIPEVSFGEGFWTRSKALERSFYNDEETMALARFFDKGVFDAVHGFDERLVGFDDRDLHFRIVNSGGKVSRSEAIIRHNEGRVRISRLMGKKYLYGKTLHQYLSTHRGESNTQWLFLRVTFVKHWGKMIRHPILAVGMAFMQVCELSAAAAGYLAGRIKPLRVSDNE